MTSFFLAVSLDKESIKLNFTHIVGRSPEFRVEVELTRSAQNKLLLHQFLESQNNSIIWQTMTNETIELRHENHDQLVFIRTVGQDRYEFTLNKAERSQFYSALDNVEYLI